MVIGDLHIKGIAFLPLEADPPLIIDPDAVLSFPIPFKCFQAVTGRLRQILERPHAVQIQKLPPGLPLNGLKPTYGQVIEQSLSIFV
jgi:hypothetical protein